MLFLHLFYYGGDASSPFFLSVYALRLSLFFCFFKTDLNETASCWSPLWNVFLVKEKQRFFVMLCSFAQSSLFVTTGFFCSLQNFYVAWVFYLA